MRTLRGTDSLDIITPQNITCTCCQYFMISLIYPKMYLYIQHICIIYIIWCNALYKPANNEIYKRYHLMGYLNSHVQYFHILYTLCKNYTYIQNVTVRVYTLKHVPILCYSHVIHQCMKKLHIHAVTKLPLTN